MIFTTIDPISSLLGQWSIDLTLGSIILRLTLATIVGGLIGAERSNKHHTAGLRTNILVCLGSCVAMIVNQFLDGADNARLGAAVLTGIGFIGAGSIMVTSRSQVTGITTAAALWGGCCIGLAIGCGFYTVAIVATILVVICLICLPAIEAKLKESTRGFELHVELNSRPDLAKLLDLVRSKNIVVKSITYDPAYANTGLSVYSISFFSQGKNYVKYNELIEELKKLDYVHHVDILN